MESYAKKLRSMTFSVHHSPNCTKPYQVRLIGKSGGCLDNIMDYRKTKDILGFGCSLEEAARDAWQRKNGKR